MDQALRWRRPRRVFVCSLAMGSDVRYYRVSPRFWSSAERRGWPDDTRILALYLLTGPHRTTEGLYRLPLKYAQADLEWSSERLAQPLSQLSTDGFCEYDEDAQVVLVVGAMKYQQCANPNMANAAVKRLAELPETRLSERFRRLAEQYDERLAERLPEPFGKPQALPQALPQAQAPSGRTPPSDVTPTWKQVLQQHRQKLNGKASYDLLAVYRDAGLDLTRRDDIDVSSQLIPLVCDYVGELLGEAVTGAERKLVAKTVRKHGLWALKGWDVALGRTEQDDPRQRMAYAQAVINRSVTEAQGKG